MRRIFETIYAFWGLICFCFFYIMVFPLFFIIAQVPKWHSFANFINKLWAGFVFTSALMPVKIIWDNKIKKGQPYVFCPNHNSYLDIPIIGISAPAFVVFVGKSSLGKIPGFGYMFKKIHIPVDRASIKSSYRSFELAKKAVDKGHSLLIFPEGGINTMNYPDLKKFKDGPFRIAIEKQIPIVPVTIPYNWIILYDISTRLKWKPVKVIYHEPIETKGMKLNDIDLLKEKVKRVIKGELKTYFPDKITFDTGNVKTV
ncbi:MAG: 1-acyl-sn-glycerol-3-phosphate acyltransferase [Flammeovirgaceae bacterium]|nr:1-acyl-sn-glycerol-3-phosphate acyltransferase [Flammeovirgaceae bacterium]